MGTHVGVPCLGGPHGTLMPTSDTSFHSSSSGSNTNFENTQSSQSDLDYAHESGQFNDKWDHITEVLNTSVEDFDFYKDSSKHLSAAA